MITAILVLASTFGSSDSAKATDDSIPSVSYVAPALEILGANFAMAAVNKYVRGVEYAHIDQE
ncbi:MAG: hypothetical protein RL318_1744, partial [Fibrobacterota bacterium]